MNYANYFQVIQSLSDTLERAACNAMTSLARTLSSAASTPSEGILAQFVKEVYQSLSQRLTLNFKYAQSSR